jgi:5-methylcytosine-specific restriction endonuclease McrA
VAKQGTPIISCLECGMPFRQAHRQLFTCNPRCRTRHETRVFRLRREYASLRKSLTAYLLERDRRRCGICRKPIRARSGPAGPAVDHIIPLNRGGTNELSNFQIAHWRCNSAKCDRGGGEQLLLFG